MINNIDEKSERRARELEEMEFKSLVELCGKEPPVIEDIAKKIEEGLANGNNKLKKMLAKGLYERGEIDKAFEMLEGVPPDDETRELHRALRYASEAQGIVSNIDPETERYFEELSARLGITK